MHSTLSYLKIYLARFANGEFSKVLAVTPQEAEYLAQNRFPNRKISDIIPIRRYYP